MISEALQEVGAARSIVIDEDGWVLAGNATIDAAGQAGIEKVRVIDAEGDEIIAVRRSNLTRRQKTRLALYDNQTADLAEWDDDVLKKMFEKDAKIFDKIFRENELQEFGIEQEEQDAEPQIDRAEELNNVWQVKTGDLWKIGEHRLLCGDSTLREDVERVMGGEKAGAVVTDPPYGINREGIENDNPEGLAELFKGCLAVMPIENGVIIAFQSPRLFPVWLDAIRAAGHKFERALWMYDENDQTKPWHYWLMCSQIAIISTLGKAEWIETKAHHDTYVIGLSREWRAGGEGNEYAHASVKPVGVIQDITRHFGGDVYDPFLGSGTTMVACQNLNRKCRGIEISPAYCSVVLQRMKDAFPGIEIERIEDGTA
jgi:hypothetical protein